MHAINSLFGQHLIAKKDLFVAAEDLNFESNSSLEDSGAATLDAIEAVMKHMGITFGIVVPSSKRWLLSRVNHAHDGRYLIVKDIRESSRLHCVGVIKSEFERGFVFDDSHQFAIVYSRNLLEEIIGGRNVVKVYRLCK